MEYQFEKNKLYNYLGTHLVNTLKKYNAIVAGGLITSLFCNREIKDVDIYFRDEKSLFEFIEDVYEDSNDWINALTSKAILVRIDDKEVQMIHFKFFKDANEIFNTFDFTVCMGAFDFATEEFVLHDEFLKHNSQRILKFNKDTAYPVVSLLRVHKYSEKGYRISKPEFLRIALKCMDLKIETVEDLKEHLGGMYGINLDKLVKLEENESFSIDLFIDKIANLSFNEDYFKEPERVEFKDVDEIIAFVSKEPSHITHIHKNTYIIRSNGALKAIQNVPPKTIEHGGKEIVEGRKFYKFVRKSEGRYYSYWDKSFEYIIGKEVAPKYDDYLYFAEQQEIDQLGYEYEKDSVLIEAYIAYGDFHIKSDEKVLTKKCCVIREVPKEEWKKWIG